MVYTWLGGGIAIRLSPVAWRQNLAINPEKNQKP